MEENNKNREQLLEEISELRKRVKELENAEKKQNFAENHSFDPNVIIQSIFNSIPQGIYWIDKNSFLMGCNKQFVHDLNFNCQEEIIGRSCNELILADTGKIYWNDYEKIIANDTAELDIETQRINADGTKSWLKLDKIPLHDNLGNVIGMLGIYDDITEHKKRLEKLEQDRILLRTLIDNLPDAIFAKDVQGRKIIANIADLNNMGCNSEQEVIGKTDFDFFPKEIAESFIANDVSVIKTGKSILKREEYYFDSEGKKHWLHTSKLPLKDNNGNIIGLVGVGRDITEMKLAQEELQKERILLRTLIDNIPDAVYVKDSEYRKTIANLADVRNTGMKCESNVIGKTDFDLFPKEIAEGFYADDESVMKSGKPVLHREEFFIDSDGVKHWLYTSKLPLRDEEGNIVGLIGIGRDITAQKKFEAELQDERNFLRTLIDNLPDFIYFKDNQARYVLNNKAHLSSLGVSTQDEVLAKTTFDFNPYELAEKYFNDEMKIIHTGQPMLNKEEMVVYGDTGDKVWHLTSKVPLKRDDKVIGIVGISRDITQQKLAQKTLQRERNQLRTLIDNLPDLIFFKDLRGRYILNNKAHLNFIGVNEQHEALGKTVMDFHPQDEAEKFFKEELEVIVSGVAAFEVEQVIYHKKKNEKRWYIVSRIPLKDNEGKVKGILGVGHDITNRKLAEEALKQTYNELEQTNNELKKANKIKSQFLANMSHEIRTPLNAVIGMTGLLLDTQLNEEQRDFTETILNSSDILLSLINDILDFSKIEAQKIELEKQPFDVRNCVEEALELIASKAAAKNLELAYSLEEGLSTNVVGDLVRLRQILINLLSNSIKFTEEGEVVVNISGQLKDHYSYQLHFKVRDTGLGIPAERQNRLFQSFTQVDASTTRKFGGTGLGLAISKKLCELMGGAMWVESSGIPGEGSTFHFTILTELSIESEKRTELSALIGKRVLIVDDNQTNRNILIQQAASLQMTSIGVESGPKALKLLENNSDFDIAILDYQMPEMDGVMLAKEIRDIEIMKSMPLILLSSYGYHLEKNNDLSIFAATLTKPIKFSQLCNALIMVLNKNKGFIKKQRDIKSMQFDSNIGKQYPLKLLVAEDNMINQKVALKVLEKLGYRADVVFNGLEVLDALKRQHYDVILMDVQMPELDGEQATIEIRRSVPSKQQPRIVAMTANALKSDQERYLAAGMDDYIVKPFKVEELVRALIESYTYLYHVEVVSED